MLQFLRPYYFRRCPWYLVLSGCGLGLSEAEEHFNAGVELQERGKWEEAIAEYDEAIRLDPKFADAYYNRGNAYADLRQYEEAIQDYGDRVASTVVVRIPSSGLYSRGRGYAGRERSQTGSR